MCRQCKQLYWSAASDSVLQGMPSSAACAALVLHG